MRILIADDHAIVRRGLIQILTEEYPTIYIEEAADAEALVAKVTRDSWDIVISDLSMPGRSGLDALRQIRQLKPELPVIIMSIHPEDQYAIRVLKAGAYAFLGKDCVHDELVPAIKTILQGRKYITPSIAEKLLEAISREDNQPLFELLSDREFEVFRLLAGGKSVTEIAGQFALSANTVSTYRSRVLEKMNMKSNAELTRYAMEKGLL
ncbi:MAG: response regulator transcription factor [Chitinophagaceae bacterium]|nr:response regulator transcription factor [Chitinophagaceae bacterium]MBL0335260.1 response regulator transcription factor [Chitinophagaceae bacterium]